ncbi:MAG TPA: glycosyltransferase family 39 protein [Roseiflexaceae bacterium]|nr:glycosyltransferase family 39 protein [Roseiflexaceae bacterium]
MQAENQERRTENQEPLLRRLARSGAPVALAAMGLAVLLMVLATQLPVIHIVDIGGYDGPYTQGFYDPERGDMAGPRVYLDGSNGAARWTGASAYLLFPQAGLPAEVILRLRGRPVPAPPTELTVLLNGAIELGRVQAGPEWQEHFFPITDGLLKPQDVVIELRSAAGPLSAEDQRPVGVLLDQAIYRTGWPPLAPYPAQLAYGALAAGMLALLLRSQAPSTKNREPRTENRESSTPTSKLPPAENSTRNTQHSTLAAPAAALAVALLYLLLYRVQPFPYPLRGLLPGLDVALAGLLALRYAPALGRWPRLADLAALGGVALWTGAVLLRAREHVVLSLPGVENDFRVFALRSARLLGQFPAGTTNADLDGVLRADGFYNLGYPLLLWLARPLAQDNPFLAARLVAALSGAVLLLAVWWLARRLLGRAGGLLALLVLALSPLVVEYALYLGTDMPFAALCALALALLAAAVDARPEERSRLFLPALAGLTAGAAFLIRHPGILLLPLGLLALWTSQQTFQQSVPDTAGAPLSQLKTQNSKLKTQHLVLFAGAFLLAALPQLAVNLVQTGQPLYSRQAENIWLAVYGGGNWQRSGEVPRELSLSWLVLADPGRFAANWLNNLRGFFGAGGEDTSEFGRAVQLRLLAFPANWLAVVGLLGWIAQLLRSGEARGLRLEAWKLKTQNSTLKTSLLWLALYVGAVTVGLSLDRFYLALVPVYALAAAWALLRLRGALPWLSPMLAGLLLAALLAGGFSTGAGLVLGNQQPDEATIVRLAQARLGPGERVAVRVPARVALGKYSAIAHQAAPAPEPPDAAALRAGGFAYLLWSSAEGEPPAVGPEVGRAGVYGLYQIK